jgi:hypothetical protein
MHISNLLIINDNKKTKKTEIKKWHQD